MRIELLVIILLMIIFYSYHSNINTDSGKVWYQCPGKTTKKLLKKSLIKNGINRTHNKNSWDIYVPCSNTKSEMKNLLINNPDQIVMMVSNNWIIGTKKYLWTVLKNAYGRDFCSTLIPRTYIMPEDIKYFDKEYDKSKMYILKQEKQRQEGLYLSKSKTDILNKTKNGLFKVVQEYEPKCYLYKGHKINIRIYVLLVCNKRNIKAYVYDDGIISYTKNKYKPNSLDFDLSIASFYTSQPLYNKGWPITINEFKKEYEKEGHIWENLFSRIKRNLYYVTKAVRNKICKKKSTSNNITCELFGADFILDDQHNVKILEMNKGPGMSPFKDEDKRMRTKLQEDILEIVGIKKNKSIDNGFEQIN